jgi:hypothetical protein
MAEPIKAGTRVRFHVTDPFNGRVKEGEGTLVTQFAIKEAPGTDGFKVRTDFATTVDVRPDRGDTMEVIG